MRSHRRPVAAVAASALVAAACGSSSKKAAPSATTTVANTAAAAGGSSGGGDIVIEGLAQLSFYPGLDTAFQARITRFNNQGGVNGRKIKFIGIQDTGTTRPRR